MRAPLPRLRWLIAGALLVLALVTVGIGQTWLHAQRSHDERDAAIRTAADTTVTALLSYDYRRLRAGMAATMPLLVGDARSDYSLMEKPLLTTAPKIHAVVVASVKSMTLLQADDDSARVLLFVDQASTSTRLSRPQVDQSRTLVTMQKRDGKWLVSTVRAF